MDKIPASEKKLVQAVREFYVKNPALKNKIHVLEHLQKMFYNPKPCNKPIRAFNGFGVGKFDEFLKKHGLEVASQQVATGSKEQPIKTSQEGANIYDPTQQGSQGGYQGGGWGGYKRGGYGGGKMGIDGKWGRGRGVPY